MPYKGQQFSNPATGERVVLLEAGADNAGQYVRFRTSLPQGKGFEVLHFHQIADETFVVESGWLSYKLDGIAGKIGPGESITLPPNRAHAHWNADEAELVMVQTISPCHDTDKFLENLFGLAMDGKLDAKGTPPFLQIMVWNRGLKSKTYLAAIPRQVQDALAILLAPLAKLLGYRCFYPKYAG